MALTLLKNWGTEILTDTDLEGEFNNIYNNALNLISPLTGDLNLNAKNLDNLGAGTVSAPSLDFTGDSNTGIYSSAADTFDITAGGKQVASFGASHLLYQEDARTNTVDVLAIFRSLTTGVPAGNIGTGIQFDADSDNAGESPMPIGRLDFYVRTMADTSEETSFDILLRTGGAALATRFRLRSTGGFITEIASPPTADRILTLPDATDTLVGKATTDTLTNKTLSGSVVTGAAGATPTAEVIYTDSIVKGWLETSGAGAWTIDADLNVSSITDNGTGDFTINWATAFTTANYAVAGIAITSAGPLHVSETNSTAKTTALVRILIHDTAGAAADPGIGVNIIAIGIN